MDTSINRSAYVESLLNRLRRHYVERTPLPARGDEEGEALTFALLRRLCEHVLNEGYGEEHEAG
ncbi:MAG TPA: hypothetical protein VNL77_07250 [Roseiflexaceae bacterium]|nr:hypothetical protein [Roseiflexaceae bacterium]